MSTVSSLIEEVAPQVKIRKPAISDGPAIFTEIYQEDINISIWQRELSGEVKSSVDQLLATHQSMQETLVATPSNVFEKLINANPGLNRSQTLCRDMWPK